MTCVLALLLDTTVSPDPTWLTSAGVAGVLATVVIGFWKGWIVSGSTFDKAVTAASTEAERLRLEKEAETGRLREERDRALEQVYKQAEIAQRALEALERKSVA